MDTLVGVVLILAYMAWSVYAGWKVLSGRSEWLDRNAPLNKVVKFIVCFAVGQVIGTFYLIYLIFKLIFRR